MDNKDVQLSSMSWCRLRPEYASKFQAIAQNQEIKLVEKNACVHFVSKEQYHQLMFILGRTYTSFTDNYCKYEELLTHFNNFDTSNIENFKQMLEHHEFPYKYNECIPLVENRRLFKDFFSFLTNV